MKNRPVRFTKKAAVHCGASQRTEPPIDYMLKSNKADLCVLRRKPQYIVGRLKGPNHPLIGSTC
jgi:hypothetical protein